MHVVLSFRIRVKQSDQWPLTPEFENSQLEQTIPQHFLCDPQNAAKDFAIC
jgi:hypothetical protein